MYAHLRPELHSLADRILTLSGEVLRGGTWTTDAPYRYTAAAVACANAGHVCAVEMEAAALYAFAEARGNNVICFAHVTNRMATQGDDFEKGADDGNGSLLRLISTITKAAKVDS